MKDKKMGKGWKKAKTIKNKKQRKRKYKELCKVKKKGTEEVNTEENRKIKREGEK